MKYCSFLEYDDRSYSDYVLLLFAFITLQKLAVRQNSANWYGSLKILHVLNLTRKSETTSKGQCPDTSPGKVMTCLGYVKCLLHTLMKKK